MNKYYRTYRLKKDSPDYVKGWLYSWCGIRRCYMPHEALASWHDQTMVCSPHSIDYGTTKTSYTKERIEAETEWFEPFGKSSDFYPKFPSRSEITQYAYLQLETRLVDSFDEARCLSDLFTDKEFEADLYEFVKEKYNKKYFNI